MSLPTAAELINLHDRLLASAGWPAEAPASSDDSLRLWIQTNYRFNC